MTFDTVSARRVDERQIMRLFVAGSILLFYLQAMRVGFSVLFGIIYDQVFEGPIDAWLFVSVLLILIAMIVPILAPRDRTGRWQAFFAIITSLARLGLTINDAGIRYWGSLFVLIFGSLYLTTLMAKNRRMALTGLLIALSLDQLLRAAGSTYDLSLRSGWLPIQILWVILIVFLNIWLKGNSRGEEHEQGGFSWMAGLAFGGFVFIEANLLSFPNGISRWTHTSYEIIAPALIGVTTLMLIPGVQTRLWRLLHSAMVRVLLIGLVFIGLLCGYFMEGLLVGLGLIVMQLIVLTFVVGLFLHIPGAHRSAGGRLALGLIFFVLLNFLNAFAFTYPYVLPVMRNMGWAVFLIAALSIGIGVASLPRGRERTHPFMLSATSTVFVFLLATGLTILSVWPQPKDSLPTDGKLSMATYNIHYGYDDDWHFTLEDMAIAIEEVDVDVVAMQEVDTGRITSYSVDDAYYLSRRLRMNVVYLSTVEHLTGIALLYRGPIAMTDKALISSLQEQTGIVHARLDFQDQSINAYGIWLGLSDEDTLTQVEEALAFIGDTESAVFGGDFNAEYDSPEMLAVRNAGFRDPFLTLGIDPPPLTAPAIVPTSRIDFVWLRGLLPNQAWASESLASDHRMVAVEVEIP